MDRIEVLEGRNELGDVAVLNDLSGALVDLYRGRFLAGDLDLAWTIRCAIGLHARFLRALATLGRAWEAIGEYERAIVVYRHGLQVDQGAELLYQHP